MKAGGAWVHDQSDVNLLGLNLNLGGGAVVVTPASLSSWRSGWVFGTGVEQAVFGNWSAKIEYNYMDFNDRTENFPVIRSNAAPIINGLFDRFDLTSRVHTIKFGVNYRFGWGSY